MFEVLQGYKTKLVILGTIFYAVMGLYLGEFDANTAYQMILLALGGYGIYDKLDRK